MAITRKLTQIRVSFTPDGTPLVEASAIVSDSEEGTRTGAVRKINAQAILTIAADLRDAVITLSEMVGKPVTVTEN